MKSKELKIRNASYYFVALCNYNDEITKKSGYFPRRGDCKPVFVAMDIEQRSLSWMYRIRDSHRSRYLEASENGYASLPPYCEQLILLNEDVDTMEYDVIRFILVSSDELLRLYTKDED